MLVEPELVKRRAIEVPGENDVRAAEGAVGARTATKTRLILPACAFLFCIMLIACFNHARPSAPIPLNKLAAMGHWKSGPGLTYPGAATDLSLTPLCRKDPKGEKGGYTMQHFLTGHAA